jgi:hypothetical protein
MSSAVESLEQRIAALEIGNKYDATKEEVRKVELEFLEKLREIRAQVLVEQGKGGTFVNSAEVEALRKENEMLKKTNEKLSYRVKHVVASLNAFLEEKQAK